MGFACECYDYDTPSVFSETTQAARKEYQCTECRQPIMPGETYVRIFGVWDGVARTYFNCERCNDLAAAFQDVGYCWSIGEFITAYTEWLHDEGKKRPAWLEEITT